MQNKEPSMVIWLRRASLVALAALLVTACSSGVKHAEPSVTTPVGSTGAEVSSVTASSIPGDELGQANGPLATRSVYFDFDSYVVQEQYLELLSAHANYLMAHGDRRIRIEGNTDERGPSEYNLALGQKRSEAVRNVLRLDGVPDSQMETVSFGKEKPKASEHDEAAWAENRRADLDYLH